MEACAVQGLLVLRSIPGPFPALLRVTAGLTPQAPFSGSSVSWVTAWQVLT